MQNLYILNNSYNLLGESVSLMAYRGGGETTGGGGLGPMAGVIMVMIGLVVVVAIMQFAPTIGGSIAAAQPTLGVNNPWNNTCATALGTPIPSSVGLYSNNVTLVSLLITIKQKESASASDSQTGSFAWSYHKFNPRVSDQDLI